jgi:predicted secreted Zn-dependent protease
MCLLFAILFLLTVSTAFAQEITYEYYPVVPQAGRSIYKELFADSTIEFHGKKVAAITDWDIEYNCEYNSISAKICEIAEYDVRSTCHVTLPKLITDEKRLNNTFDEYMTYLKKHELNHCKIADDYAAYLEEQLDKLKSQRAMDCQALKNAVKSARNTAITEAKAAHRLFDQQTLENRKNFHAGTYFLGDLYPGD